MKMSSQAKETNDSWLH